MANTTPEANLTFVLQVLQSAIDGGCKIDYDSIAESHGLSKQKAYMKLWALRKKAGLTSSTTNNGDDTGNTVHSTGKKRGRPSGKGKEAKSKGSKFGTVDTGTGDGFDDVSVRGCDDAEVEDMDKSKKPKLEPVHDEIEDGIDDGAVGGRDDIKVQDGRE